MLQPFFSRLGLVVVALLAFQLATAQNIKIGIRAGVLLANLDITPTEDGDADLKNKAGLQVAIPLEIGLGSMFSIQPEIMYGFNGTRTNETLNETSGGITTTGHSKASIKVDALEIPLLAKVKFGPEAFKIHVLAGPSVGFGLSGKLKNDLAFKSTDANGTVLYETSGVANGKPVFLKDNFKEDEVGGEDDFPFTRTNFNLHLGAGFSINVGNMSVFLDGRYIIGFTDLFPDQDGLQDNQRTTAKSQRIGISAGILFPL